MMSKECIRRTEKGKGNAGMFNKQDPKKFAAAKPDKIFTTAMENSSSLVYDLITPKDYVPDYSFPKKRPGYQTDRNYCRPPYNPKAAFGMTCQPDKRGTYAKRSFTPDGFTNGPAWYSPMCASDDDTIDTRNTQLGVGKSSNDIISCIPSGHGLGTLKPPDKLTVCLTPCELNSGREFFLECLCYLNSVRKCLSKRFDGNFFKSFYLQLKYLDKTKTGWLPKQVVYDFCSTKLIRFNPRLIEPLLKTWNAFDGSLIEYKIFVHVINYGEASPELPKIPDVLPECIEFSTTYGDMVSPGQKVDTGLKAGFPSVRYWDQDYPVTSNSLYKTHRVCFSEESDARSCLNPSVFTVLGINHHDMYAKRSPEEVKRVFGVLGVDLNDEKFNMIWEEAKKSHSQGWVSFETFKTAFLINVYDDENLTNDK